MRLMKLNSWIAAIGLVVAASGPAAASTITIFDGSTTLTITDQDFIPGPNAPADMAGAAGIVSYAGTIGVWTFSVSTGFSKPAYGSATVPEMHLDGSALSSAAGTLTITFTDTGFGSTGTLVEAGVGGATDGTVKYEALQGATSLVSLVTAFNEEPYKYSDVTELTGGVGPYSLTQKITLTHKSSWTVSSFNATLSVPEGGATLSLLGLGLLGIVGVGRLTRSSRA